MIGFWNEYCESFRLSEFDNECIFLTLLEFNAVQQSDKLLTQALDAAFNLNISCNYMNLTFKSL